MKGYKFEGSSNFPIMSLVTQHLMNYNGDNLYSDVINSVLTNVKPCQELMKVYTFRTKLKNKFGNVQCGLIYVLPVYAKR